jgi:diguanylate cyclase (GGDEF)-like protein
MRVANRLAADSAPSSREADRQAWRVAMAMFGVGALTLLAVLPSPDPDTSDHPALLAVAALYGVVTLALWLLGPSSRLVVLAPLFGVLTVSLLVGAARPLAATPFFYLWPLLHGAYFYSRRYLLAVEGTLVLTYAAALVFSPPGQRATYFLAGVVATALAAAVVNHLKRQVDGLVADLHDSAATDPLTGLLNRRAFSAEFDRELSRARRESLPLTLGMFDLDYFKRVNDSFGHAQGDRALRRVALIMSEATREHDLLARMGGEEFALLFVNTTPEAAHGVAERIAVTLAATTAEEQAPLSMSVGLASLNASASDQDALLRAADAALYEAKAAGRGRVVTRAPQELGDPHPHAVAGDEHDAAPHALLRPARGLEGGALQHPADDDPHLEVREARP